MMKPLILGSIILGLAAIVASYFLSDAPASAAAWDEANAVALDELALSVHESMSVKPLSKEDREQRMLQLAMLQKEQDDIIRAHRRRKIWLRHGGQLVTALGIAAHFWLRSRVETA